MISSTPVDGATTPTTNNLDCPRELVGRLIGKHGVSVKGIQLFSGAVIEINQQVDPSTIVIIGSSTSVALARGIVTDIVKGQFKGFKLLRELVAARNATMGVFEPSEMCVYAPGIGMFPRHQLFSAFSGTHTYDAAAATSNAHNLGDDHRGGQIACPDISHGGWSARKVSITPSSTAWPAPVVGPCCPRLTLPQTGRHVQADPPLLLQQQAPYPPAASAAAQTSMFSVPPLIGGQHCQVTTPRRSSPTAQLLASRPIYNNSNNKNYSNNNNNDHVLAVGDLTARLFSLGRALFSDDSFPFKAPPQFATDSLSLITTTPPLAASAAVDATTTTATTSRATTPVQSPARPADRESGALELLPATMLAISPAAALAVTMGPTLDLFKGPHA
jgi:hypothetical protein